MKNWRRRCVKYWLIVVQRVWLCGLMMKRNWSWQFLHVLKKRKLFSLSFCLSRRFPEKIGDILNYMSMKQRWREIFKIDTTKKQCEKWWPESKDGKTIYNTRIWRRKICIFSLCNWLRCCCRCTSVPWVGFVAWVMMMLWEKEGKRGAGAVANFQGWTEVA